MSIFLLLVVVVTVAHGNPIDQHVTTETRHLYQRLKSLASDPNKILFGQQQSTWLGAEGGHKPYYTAYSHDGGIQGWIFSKDQAVQDSGDDLCDVKRLTGEYPAVQGFDFGSLDGNQVIMNYLAERAYARGEVITISWHQKNHITGGSPWVGNDHGNVLHSVRRLLPGGDHNWKYRQGLDKISDFAHKFKDSRGHAIPVIFRPMHELNGGWFWWGLNNKAQNTEDDLKEMYRYTVRYLRDTKGVHNFLYAFSPDKFKDKNDYLKTYPGDDYVDVMGTDFYYVASTPKNQFRGIVKDVVELAESRGKIPALTEAGFLNNGVNSHPTFWGEYILEELKKQQTTRRLAYILAWINLCRPDHTCEINVPYKGHPGASNFYNDFYKDPITIFGSHVPNFYH